MKLPFTFFILVSVIFTKASMAGFQDALDALDEGENQISKECGGAGGKIISKEITINGKKTIEKTVLCSKPNSTLSSPASLPKEMKQQEAGKKSLECVSVEKYLYCNDEHFYEKVNAVVESQIQKPSVKIFDGNRPTNKPVELPSMSPGPGMNSKNSGIIDM